MRPAIQKLATLAVVAGAFIMVAAAECWQFARMRSDASAIDGERAVLRGEKNFIDAMEQKMTAAGAEQDRESARLAAAEKSLREAEAALPEIKGQEVRSLGHVERLAVEAAEFMDGMVKGMSEFSENEDNPKREEELTRYLGNMLKWVWQIPPIAKMEDTPSEIARFHALTIQQRLGLDGPTTAAVRTQIEKEFTALAAGGLTESQCPAADQKDWRGRRRAATKAAAQRVEALIPAAQRREWVVEQSLALGAAAQTTVNQQTDGHGAVSVGLDIPGVKFPGM